jgi:AcrR family transcriptional regulator
VPKIVDPEVRRREIGTAVLRLVVRQGLDGVSVRTVATEAGCSAGAVQRYFPTKRAMIGYAYELAGEEALARFAAVEAGADRRDYLRRLLVAYLPLDDDRRRHAVVWANYAVHAANDPETAAAARAVDEEVRVALADLIQRPDPVVDAILAVADGLNLRLLYGTPPTPILAALDAALDALVGTGDGAGLFRAAGTPRRVV